MPFYPDRANTKDTFMAEAASRSGTEGAGTAAASRQRTVFVSLCFDILIWIPEIVAVALTGSVTLFADVIKCGNEILATVFALLILLKMRKGGQFSYDYGMGKFETMTRVATGAVMLASLFIILYFTFQKIVAPEHLEIGGALFSVPLMLVIAAVDTYLWRKNYRIAQNDPSPILESQWRLRRAKSFADISVLLALVLSFSLSGYEWAVYIDPAASFIIIGFLLLAGYREISSSIPDLFDRTLEEELQLVILQELASSFDQYQEFYGVRSRRSGSSVYIEIFVGFDPEKKMGDVQRFSDGLKQSLEGKIQGSVVCIVPTSGRCAGCTPP
ncbi:MAG: ferrous iron efflux protein F [Methanoregula sp. PtaU1.Bin051]|nr:MAG: ferrous iron efflux protein F [Methanoregula sp. PtaU1.Bin051]